VGVYDGNGTLLVELSEHKVVTAVLFGEEYTFEVAQDGATVMLARCIHTNDKDTQCQAFEYDRRRQIQLLEKDCTAVQNELAAKQQEIEDYYTGEKNNAEHKTRVAGLESLLTLRSKHKKALSVLRDMEEQEVHFQDTNEFAAIQLVLNHPVLLPQNGKVCMFRKRPLDPAVVHKWEFATVNSVVYSTWKKENADVHMHHCPEGTTVVENTVVGGVASAYGFVYLARPQEGNVAQYIQKSGKLVRMIGSGVGSNGTEGKLTMPQGMTCDSRRLFVADFRKNRVFVYDVYSGEFIHCAGDPYRTKQPIDVAVDRKNIYIATPRLGVHIYTKHTNEYVTTIVRPNLVCAVATHASLVYITYQGGYVVVYTSTGTTLYCPVHKLNLHSGTRKVDIADSLPGIVVGSNYVFLARPENGCVEVYTQRSGALLMTLLTSKTHIGASVLRRPYSLSVADETSLLVGNKRAGCVQNFSITAILRCYNKRMHTNLPITL
jgi:hypothetical protein